MKLENLIVPVNGKEIKIEKAKNIDDTVKLNIKNILENSFGRFLIEDYFDYAKLDIIYFLINPYQSNTEKYAGTIILEKIPEIECHYIDKFAILPEYKGNCIGKVSLEILKNNFEKLFWRANKNNQIANKFYNGKASSSGVLENSNYNFFEFGLNNEEIEKAKKYAINKKPTLK